MIFVMDERGKLIRKLGNRGGGNRPGEFRFPSQVVVAGSELFVLDVGNTRIQVFDTGGHFLRAMNLGYADRRTGLAVDNRGNIYVSHPSGMWVDESRSIYVVDSQSNRVGLFQINGENAPQ